MKSSSEDGSWIKDELSKANFSDLRLNKRFSVLSQELAKQPSLPINQASTDWAATKAAYRFFDNINVDPIKILAPHILNTQLRTQGYKRIIAVQDTTVLDFSKHGKTKGLGYIAKSRDGNHELQGLFMHSTLALTEKGLPLGLLHNKIKARQLQKVKGHNHTKIPAHKKESFKWFEGLRSAKAIENAEVVMVCDREADIYELFEEAQDYGIEMVVRMRHDRITYEDEFDYLKITDRLALEKYFSTKVKVKIPGSGRRKPRQAELSMRTSPITLSSQPRGIKTDRVKNRRDIDLHVVELHELKPPKGEKALVWYLLTTLEMNQRKDALEVMNIYKMRWQVEQYFKCLKTGCRIEDCRLNSADKLINYVSLQAIIAWRILWMTHLNRSDPSLSCELVLTKTEWEALWLQKNKRAISSGKLKAKPPKDPPSIGDAIRWIAMMGGFLGRKNDGHPGLISIWRGWIRLAGAAEIYALLKN